MRVDFESIIRWMLSCFHGLDRSDLEAGRHDQCLGSVRRAHRETDPVSCKQGTFSATVDKNSESFKDDQLHRMLARGQGQYDH